MFLGFGEIMARIAPSGQRRWRQTLPGSVDVTWGGGEANVCASLAMYGRSVRYLTALPSNELSQCIVDSLRGLGVDTTRICWRDQGRLGLYFVEHGANQRGSTVVYDREYSAVSMTGPTEYNFDDILNGVTWLHVTGITPAISRPACEANLALVKAAKERGVAISCDLNFRKKLWRWDAATEPKELARRNMAEVLPFVDLVIGNEEDAADVLDIHAAETDVSQGRLNIGAYQDVAEQIVARFPNVKRVAITLRESISANINRWGAMLYETEDKRAYFAPSVDGEYTPYDINDIVDRVGAGDSFGAGLLHALHHDELQSPQNAIEFAVAASCLKHSVPGDFNYVSEQEVRALMGGNATGRVQR